MKKIIIVLLLFSSTAFAQHVSTDIAIKVSTLHMRNTKRSDLSLSYVNQMFIDRHLCLYEVVFDDSSWCIIPADMKAAPILAYGFQRKTIEGWPDSFLKLIEWYKSQIDTIIYYCTDSIKTHPSWAKLVDSKQSGNYIVGDSLLDMTGRGQLCWQQGKNNDNGCTPSYNQDCPTSLPSCYSCSHYPVGCAAVALGELLWYWRWPTDSDQHDWDAMPSRIRNTSALDSASKVSKFLKECGESVNMTYQCSGSFAIMNNIVNALYTTYNYKGAHKLKKTDWDYGSTWNNIIKSELDNKRPVIFYGDSWAFFVGHYFVVDGYQENYGSILYHVNWGHGGWNNCFCKLDRFKEIVYDGSEYDTHYYDINNRVIVGISPTYSTNQNITEFYYSNIHPGYNRQEYATNSISLPSSNNTLTIEPSGKFALEAGHTITLKDGFWAKRGSEVSISINNEWVNGMAISVPHWHNSAYMGSDGYSLEVVNADSWEFSLYDVSGGLVYQSAGSIGDDGIAHLWDGTNMSYGIFYGFVRFKNSYGRELVQEQFPIYVISPSAQYQEMIPDSNTNVTFTINNLADSLNNTSIDIYPNPSEGIFSVNLTTDTIIKIIVYNSQGLQVYSDDNIGLQQYLLNLSSFPRGNYIVSVRSHRRTYTSKITKQ